MTLPAGDTGTDHASPPVTPRKQAATRQFVCPACGASLHAAIGPDAPHLLCAHCATKVPITTEVPHISAHDFEKLLQQPRKPLARLRSVAVTCRSCGAETTARTLSGVCPFCAAARVIVDSPPEDRVVPQAVLPFSVTEKQAVAALARWTQSRWFAPSALKRLAIGKGLNCVYLPFFTFDSDTQSEYAGMRGDAYYTTEWRTVTDADGNTRTESYTVRRVRWTPVAGSISQAFTDVLVGATDKVPFKHVDGLIGSMEPVLDQLIPYDPAELAGFTAHHYTTELTDGFCAAKGRMEPVIDRLVRADIGGDEQSVTTLNIAFFNVGFKYVLVPVWMASYTFKKKTWHVYVDGRSGAVTGDRPVSAAKIVALVVAILVVLAGVGVGIFFGIKASH